MVSALRAYWVPGVATAPTVTAIGKPRERAALPAAGVRVGRYTVLEQLGAGAMGAVFLASDPELGRRVAIKLLSSRGGDDRRLLDEARALAKLQHPHVVAIHDVGRWDDRVYIAMEHIAGRSLDRWLEEHPAWRDRLDAFRQAALGLAAAHKAGIVHHDIKPSNIMAGDDGRVRLVDFGLARSTTPDGGSGSGGGTPRYMSPEQRRGAPADARTDQFSLCVAMYEALFAGHPFEGNTAEERNESVLAGRIRLPAANEVPAATRDAILKGLACDPAERHASMAELLAAIAPPPPPRRTWLVGATVAFAAIAGIGAAYGMRSHPAPPTPHGKYDAILAASHLPPTLDKPIPGDVFGVTVHRLSNGLTVMISPDHDVPRISASLRINAGNGDNPGVAELAMGLLHKGTETIGTTDYAKEKPYLDKIREQYAQRAATTDPAKRAAIDADIDAQTTAASQYEIPEEHTKVMQALGAHFNQADNSRDFTRFVMEIPSNRLEVWADLEADRFAHPVIRMFRSQVAEIAQWNEYNDNNFLGVLASYSTPKIFDHAGYGFDASSVRKKIEEEPYTEVEEFIRDYYVPNNAQLILTGDVDPVTAIPILERAFAKWEPRPLPPRPLPELQPVKAETIDVPTPGGNRSISYHWATTRSVQFDHALEMMDFLLTRELTKREVNAQTGNLLGGYFVMVTPNQGESLEAAQQAIDQAISDMREGKFTDEMLVAAKRSLRARREVLNRDADTRMYTLRIDRDPLYLPTWQQEAARLADVDKASRADVMRLANELLGASHLTLRAEPGAVERHPLYSPKLPPTHYSDQRSKAAAALIARDVVPLQPKFLTAGVDYTERDTDAGHLVVTQDPKEHLATLELRWDIGNDELLYICANKGARNKGLLPRRYDSGFWDVGSACGGHLITVKTTGLDDQLSELIDLAFADLDKPTDAEWQANAEDLATQLATTMRGVDWIRKWAEEYAVFGPSQLSRFDLTLIRAGTPADGARSADQLRHAPMWIGYRGPRSLDEVAKLLPPRPAGKAPVPTPKQLVTGPPKVYLIDAHTLSDTANVSMLYGATHVLERRAQFILLEGYWAPELHPIANELRGHTRFETEEIEPNAIRDPGTVAFRLQTTPADAPAAIEHTLHEVFEVPHDPAILARAKQARDEMIRADWASRVDLLDKLLGWRINGQADDPRVQFRNEWAQVGMKELDALTTELRHAPHAIVVWGNLAGLDRKALAKYGILTDISLAQLLDVHHSLATSPAGVKKPARGGRVAKRKK